MTKINQLNHPLTNDEVQALFPGINIVAYPSLKNYKTINELCNNKYNACFILYINDSPEYNCISGHWCLLINDKKDKCVHLFDPYGMNYIDNNLIEIGPDRDKFMEDKPYLSELLVSDDNIKKIYFNSFPYQKLKDNISTCGKHCAIRLVFYEMGYKSEEEYKKALDKIKKKLKIKDYDNLVNYLIIKNI